MTYEIRKYGRPLYFKEEGTVHAVRVRKTEQEAINALIGAIAYKKECERLQLPKDSVIALYQTSAGYEAVLVDKRVLPIVPHKTTGKRTKSIEELAQSSE